MDTIHRYASLINVRLQSQRPNLDPATLQLLIGLITTLIGLLPACFGGATGPIAEGMAYRYVTRRPFFLNRTVRIRAVIKKTWQDHGGHADVSDIVTSRIDELALNVGWADFDSAWQSVHNRRTE